MNNAKSVVAALLAFGSVLSASAANFYLKESVSGTDFSWREGSNYEEGKAPETSEDVIVVKSGIIAKLKWTEADHADFDFVNTLGRILPLDDAVVEIDVAEGGEVTLEVPVSGYGNATKKTAELAKSGAGSLTLASCGKVMAGAWYGDYYVVVHVKEGALHLNRNIPEDMYAYYLGAIVDKGATLFTCTSGYTDFRGRGLWGEGLVTNDSPQANRILELRETEGQNSVFAGTFGNPVYIFAWSQFDLTGTNTMLKMPLILNDGADVGVMSFGANNTTPSSIGLGNPNFNRKSGIRYLGTGETSSKSFYLGMESTVDAGANGGLVFTGYWGPNGTGSLRNLILTGSNSVESVLSNAFYRAAGDDLATRFIKRGTGVWRLAHNANRKNKGVVAAEEGTLRFDSIAETDEVCSLGLSSLLYNETTGDALDENRVPYAFLLGGTATEGLMEYTGATAGYCATRLSAIRSKGGFRTSASPIRIHGFTAESAGEKTLVLDGDNADENVAAGVTNGPGVVSILKRGSGTWYLDGERDFSGTVRVDEGTLVARAYTNRYSWYRFTIRETGFTTYPVPLTEISQYEQGGVQVLDLPLIGDDGEPQNRIETTCSNYRAIRPGEIAYWKDGLDSQLSVLPRICTGGTGQNYYTHFSKAPAEADPSTWVPIIMRLADGSRPVIRFNMLYNLGDNGTAPHWCNRHPTSFVLEGSADGFTWDNLYETNKLVYASGVAWLTELGSTYFWPRKNFGIPIASGNGKTVWSLGNATGVSVAKGATLNVEGEAKPVSKFVVDCDKGVGTISGVTFADSGTLVLENVPRSGFIPVNHDGITGYGNLANWTVSTPGCTKTRTVTVTDAGIGIASPGLMIILR